MSPLVRAANRTFASLAVKNYRLFIAGQLVSMTGTWMQTIALGWLVLELTESGTAVGINFALQFVPILFFGLWGGLIADRYDKRRLLLATQAGMAIVAFTLWIVTHLMTPELWMIYVLTLMLGVVTCLDNPSRQSFVTEMVGADRVSNAVSLNSAVFNASRMIGPAVAGVIISTVGISWAFLINAVTYLAVIGGLYAMDPRALHRDVPAPRERGQLRAGLRYVWERRALRYTVLLVGIVATFGFNMNVILPLMARHVFDRGPQTYGFLTAMLAAGALAGALLSAWRERPTRRFLIGSVGAFGALLIAAAFAPNVAVLTLILLPTGAASIAFISAANATLQLGSTAAMRGRVMALHGLVFLGSTPLGAPLAGWISEIWGARVGIALMGGITLAAALAGLAAIKRGALERRLRLLGRGRRPPRVTDGVPQALPAEPPDAVRRAG